MTPPTVKDIFEEVARNQNGLLSVQETATVAEAAKMMSNSNVGCLVVFNTQDQLVGIISERDMLSKVTTGNAAPQDLLVRDIMTTAPLFCAMDTPIENVEQLMAEHRIRHVPVVVDGVPVKMVSSRDIIAYQLRSNKAMKAAAEQLALLSTELKTLNLKEVVSMAIDEVPKSFEAERAVLYVPQSDASNAAIYRKACPLSRKELLDPGKIGKIPEKNPTLCTEICADCRNLGARPPRLIIPLTVQDQPDGGSDSNAGNREFLCMCRLQPDSADSEKLLLYKASLMQEILSVNLTNAKLYDNYQKARRDSETDPLTNVGSRRVLEDTLKTEYARALRYHRRFSVAIADVDRFKEINDTAGHAAGDEALKQVAEIMYRSVRETDVIVVRYGGDEFVLIMPETGLSQATVLLERLRRQIGTISIPNGPQVTISCGVAEWSGSPDETAEALLGNADAALYEAKRTGRNRVVTSDNAAEAAGASPR
jgi:diguanylate cyclase (GGDEF)-like protein